MLSFLLPKQPGNAHVCTSGYIFNNQEHASTNIGYRNYNSDMDPRIMVNHTMFAVKEAYS